MGDQLWQLLGYVFALNSKAFTAATSLPHSDRLALALVLLAGLSQGIGQSIILFVNQVKPARFALSLLINAILFTLGSLALVFSTWLITLFPSYIEVAFGDLVTVLGLAYAPLLFGFLGALPYLGLPILNVLSIWHLLAMVVGFSTIAQVPVSRALGYVVVGWLLLQVLQNTVGRPLAKLGKRVANQAAGVDLVTNRRAIAETMRNDLHQMASRWQMELTERIESLALHPAQPTSGPELAAASQPRLQPQFPGRAPWRGRKQLRTALSVVALAAISALVLILLRPLREWWFGWFVLLPGPLRWILNLTWIGLVGLIVAGLLAPLETLGWWAGWYDDDLNTTVHAGELAQGTPRQSNWRRYLVYLDGIGKSTFEYLPDIEEFLATLAPSLPNDVALIRGIMPYSVMNAPLDQDRPLAFLWRYADRLRFANPASLLGLLVNIRNVLIVGVSADKRYGPLYNQGMAQVIYNGLVKNGYPLASGIPVTLVGYSGGGQMACASAPYLKRALGAPIDVISLGGVISANVNVLKLEHLYHLVGDRDSVERLGPKMFPGRWPLFPLSYWNRAKRRGKISLISLGPVGHQVPGGMLDPRLILPHGASALDQTITTINGIIQDQWLSNSLQQASQPVNYQVSLANPLGQYQPYPLDQRPDPAHYVPVADWLGRLILPAKEKRFGGVYYEIHHAPTDWWFLVGQRVKLVWSDHPLTQRMVQAVTQDVHFSADADYSSRRGLAVHPVRLNHWLQVDPLESLAGALPEDTLMAAVESPEVVSTSEGITLRIQAQPMEVTGRYYGLVQFIEPLAGSDRWRVRHFNRSTRWFDGPEEQVCLPPASLLPAYGSLPSTTEGLSTSPYNPQGWYIYGAQDSSGTFVVQALAPRALFQLRPERVVWGGPKPAYQYLRRSAWANIAADKGTLHTVLCTPESGDDPGALAAALGQWQRGDRALVLHNYGGIGGAQKEPAAFSPIFFGHFAYGRADVIHDPLADELRFDLRYYQVYAHNGDGLIAGTLHWCRYQGDRQRGWLGTRPTCDILIKLDAFTRYYDFDDQSFSPLSRMEAHLQAMTARYRIGDGTGGTFVGPSNNCSQDSNQALFAALKNLQEGVHPHRQEINLWADLHPDQAIPFEQMIRLSRHLKQLLEPFGSPRPDWQGNEFNLGSSLEDQPLGNLARGLGSWRTLLPRKASDVIARAFLLHGASLWVLRTSQVGGENPQIAPIAPVTF